MNPFDNLFSIKNEEDVPTPALLIFPDRIEENIQRIIKAAGTADRLRPHVKTHKMSGVVKLMMKHGINKFKCATIAEAEMVGQCGARDILLAIQPVGPNIDRFFNLKKGFPDIKISCIVDCKEIIMQLAQTSMKENTETSVWIDINNGMNRTGISPGDEAIRLYQLINQLPMLNAEGLHVYDGHIREKDIISREMICNEAYLPVDRMIKSLVDSGYSPIKVITGGTPTFPIHANRKGVDVSPGTLLLWDYGYSSSFSDMDFLHAAVLMMRVISKPANDLVCIDLGHKAISAEMPQPRVHFLNLENYSILNQSEERLAQYNTCERVENRNSIRRPGIRQHGQCPDRIPGRRVEGRRRRNQPDGRQLPL
jgi:D-serine deaminase-like pyridoxal phosphate-dependent protein